MKKALTIGELLVTMAIIGVIAILVLPSFLKDYHNKLYVTRLKKMYEMIELAVNQACMDNNVSYFGQTPYVQNDNYQEFLDKYFKKTSKNNTKFFANSYGIIGTNRTFNNTISENDAYAKLAGGETITYSCDKSSNYCEFNVDINSTDGPNVAGKDYFLMSVNKKTNEIVDRNPATDCGALTRNENESDEDYDNQNGKQEFHD